MFRNLESRVIINFSIRTISDLHIGGHNSIEPAEVDIPVLKDLKGHPIIPGSSLKGVLRTELERLLGSVENISVCDIFGADRGGCNKCPVCEVFGGKDLAASIRIHDSVTDSKKTLIRDSVAIDRQKRKARDGGKYDIEVVPRGTVFDGKATIENPVLKSEYKLAKLGVFLSLVDFFNACSGSIGHAVSRGFGEVEIVVGKVSVITAEDYLDGNYKGTVYDAGSTNFLELKDQAVNDWTGAILSGEYE